MTNIEFNRRPPLTGSPPVAMSFHGNDCYPPNDSLEEQALTLDNTGYDPLLSATNTPTLGAELVVRCRVRINLILTFFPILAAASIGIDIVSTDPDQEEPRGFKVTITPESLYLRVKVEYPQSISSALEPKYALVSYWAGPGEIRFFARTELDVANNRPLEFALTAKPETADASVDFHFVCTSEDPDVCDKGQEVKYHIQSIRVYISTE